MLRKQTPPLIAIVDDDPIYRKVLSFLLKKYKFDILFEAENGQDCIDKLKISFVLPTLVFVDVEMPVMDGFETVKLLKKHWPQLKIIAHSSILDHNARNKMKKNGADLFLVKNDKIVEMAEAIWQVVNEA